MSDQPLPDAHEASAEAKNADNDAVVIAQDNEGEPDVAEKVPFPQKNVDDSSSRSRSWSVNKSFRQWSANPLNNGKLQVPPLKKSEGESFGEMIDPSKVHAAKHHISKEVTTPRGSSFGELIDPELIDDISSIDKKSESPAVSAQVDSEMLLSPRFEGMDDLIKATKELEATEGADDDGAEQIFDEDIDKVGTIEADLDDVDADED